MTKQTFTICTKENFIKVTHRYRYACCEMNVFFQSFHKSLQKIDRSVLHKMTIDLLCF